MVRIQCFHCCGLSSVPGNRSSKPHSMAKTLLEIKSEKLIQRELASFLKAESLLVASFPAAPIHILISNMQLMFVK